MKPLVQLQPAFHFYMLVGSVVVADDMNLLVFGHSVVDLM